MPSGVDDPSSRGKPNSKAIARSPRTTKSSIASPPKVAIAPTKSKKEDVVRREKSMKEYLRPSNTAMATQKPGKHTTSAEASAQSSPTTQSTPTPSEEDSFKRRIADLEAALAVAHQEQTKLREHLEEFRRDSVPMRHQGVNIASPISPAAAQNFHPDQPRPQSAPEGWLLERNDLQSQVYELQHKIHGLQTDMLDRDNYWKGQWERESRERVYERNSLAEDLHVAQKEAVERRQQLLALKQSISSLTHMENQVTDGQLSERIDGIYHRVRGWVVSNFRRSQPDLTQLPKAFEDRLSHLVPHSAVLNLRAQKIDFYQAIVIGEMMEIFEDVHCYGLPYDGELGHIRTIAQELRSLTPEYRKWHSATVELVIRAADHVLTNNTQVLATSLATRIAGILHAVSGVNLPDASRTTLDTILREAIDTSRLFRLQVPLYHTYLPRTGHFDDTIMELTDEQDDEDQQSTVVLIVSPCVEKISDESGDAMRSRRTISKAKVVCVSD